jgi:hypothetical protein
VLAVLGDGTARDELGQGGTQRKLISLADRSGTSSNKSLNIYRQFWLQSLSPPLAIGY